MRASATLPLSGTVYLFEIHMLHNIYEQHFSALITDFAKYRHIIIINNIIV